MSQAKFAAAALSIKWTEKRDRDGHTIANCWLTDSGYTVAQVCVPNPGAVRYTIARPGASTPFAYTDESADVVRLITADMIATAAAEVE